MSKQIIDKLYQLIISNKDLLDFPISYSESEHFPEYVEGKLNNYYDFLKTNDVGKIVGQILWTERPGLPFLRRVGMFKDAIIGALSAAGARVSRVH